MFQTGFFFFVARPVGYGLHSVSPISDLNHCTQWRFLIVSSIVNCAIFQRINVARREGNVARNTSSWNIFSHLSMRVRSSLEILRMQIFLLTSDVEIATIRERKFTKRFRRDYFDGREPVLRTRSTNRSQLVCPLRFKIPFG